MTESQRRLDHFEIVEVRDTERTRELGVAGTRGVVVGVSDDEGDTSEPFYAVMIESLEPAVMLSARDLAHTGQRVDRSDIYDGTQVRVTKNGEAIAPPDPADGIEDP